ncbi:MAG: hypothetical protein KBT02_00255 [Treponema sp.]|nr:hypothetical protein [Candidatus Treponema caballi]
MAEETKEINAEMIYYRLDAIEKQLKDMAEDKEIQQKHGFQIHEIKETQEKQNQEIEKQNQEIEKLKSRMDVVEQAPMKSSAEKWKTISDIVFKSVITVGVTFVLAKFGLKI